MICRMIACYEGSTSCCMCRCTIRIGKSRSARSIHSHICSISCSHARCANSHYMITIFILCFASGSCRGYSSFSNRCATSRSYYRAIAIFYTHGRTIHCGMTSRNRTRFTVNCHSICRCFAISERSSTLCIHFDRTCSYLWYLPCCCSWCGCTSSHRELVRINCHFRIRSSIFTIAKH